MPLCQPAMRVLSRERGWKQRLEASQAFWEAGARRFPEASPPWEDGRVGRQAAQLCFSLGFLLLWKFLAQQERLGNGSPLIG